MEELIKTVEYKQLQWLGHLMRIEDNKQVKEIWQTKIVGKRKKGRPKKNWYNNISNILAE